MMTDKTSGPSTWAISRCFFIERTFLQTLFLTQVRTCTSAGQIRMRKVRYSLGTAWAHQDVSATYNQKQRQFVFQQIRSHPRKGITDTSIDVLLCHLPFPENLITQGA